MELPKKRRNRKKKIIQSPPPEKLIEELASIGATWEEIATVVGQPKTTLHDRYVEHYKKGASSISISVKREQHYVAMDRTHRSQATMLIWLGKQYCGQSDKSEVNQTGAMRYTIEDYRNMSDAELEREIQVLEERANGKKSA